MSLHSLLKDTWYMKLKAKRDNQTIAPSEFALRVPAIDKRNDNLLKQGHNVVVPSNTLHTYSQTNGAYIKQHTANHSEHKVSNFTPKFLALIKKSSPASNGNYDDEPPVEGGVDGASVASLSDSGEAKEKAEVKAEAKAEVKAEAKAEAKAEDLELFDIKAPEKNSGSPDVWQPVAEAYKRMKLPVVLAKERQGSSLTIYGKSLDQLSKDDLPKLKTLVETMATLRDRLDGSFFKRVRDDVKKVEKVIKRLDPEYKKERVKTPASLKTPSASTAKKTLVIAMPKAVAGGASGGGGGASEEA